MGEEDAAFIFFTHIFFYLEKHEDITTSEMSSPKH